MKIINDAELKAVLVQMEGAKDCFIKVLVGEKEGSENIIMRCFTVKSGGFTPHHSHGFEHVVKFMKNKGVMIDSEGNENEVVEGMSAYVGKNERHQFRNPFNEDFEFLCIVQGKEMECCK